MNSKNQKQNDKKRNMGELENEGYLKSEDDKKQTKSGTKSYRLE
jgi:hypothetical protein